MLNSDKTTYQPKGRIIFVFSDDEMKYFKEDYEEHMLDFYERRICGDLMRGKDFLEDVDGGCIMDYDGVLSEVFVDGYRSNLGLCHRGLCQGGFIVDGDTWLDICEEFNVEVEWCNK